MGINLRSIKIENVKAVARCLTSGEAVSRSEISATTGLSLVTVGKIVEAMANDGVVIEEKRAGSGAGRRAGWLKLNLDKTVVVAEIGEASFSVKIVDLGLNLHESFDGPSAEDVLADAAMTLLQKYGADSCIGVAIAEICPEDREKHIGLIRSFFPDIPLCVDSCVNYSAVFYSYCASEGEAILYMSVKPSSVLGAFIPGNRTIMRQNREPADFGSVRFPDGETFIDKLSHSSGVHEYAALLGDCVCNTARILKPDTVVMEIAGQCGIEGIEKMIKERITGANGLANNAPSIIYPATENGSVCGGACLSACRNWFEALAVSEKK